LTSVLEPVTSGSGSGSPMASVRTLAGVVALQGYQNGTGVEARFGNLAYNALDAFGNLYVADVGSGSIRRITPGGLVTNIVGGPGFTGTVQDGTGVTAKTSAILEAIAVTPDGLKVFFGDTNQVRLASTSSFTDPTDPGNWTITTLGGTVANGHAVGALNVSTFNQIDGMAWDDHAKVLYLSELFGNRVKKVAFRGGSISNGANWQVSVLAGDDSATNGAGGTTNGTGTNARFTNPRGVAVDQQGNVYVVDSSNNLIRKINPQGTVSTFAGSGVSGYGDGQGTTVAVKFQQPMGIAIDSSGYLYVGDAINFVVRQIDPAGNVTTVAGIHGSSGAVDGTGDVATFTHPAGISVAPDGDLLVNDSGAVRMIQRTVTTGNQ